MPIQQSYIGHLSVVGDAFCFGAALHHQTPVYLDIAGTSTSVEAVWGKLADGKEVRITPLGKTGSDVVLQPIEKGTLQRIQRKVEGIALHHLLLVHKSIQTPLYAETSLTYMIINDHD